MNSIYKFPIQITEQQKVRMPSKAKIICAQFQGETLCLWAEVELDRLLENRVIEIFGTGNPLDEDFSRRLYIGTVHDVRGGLVWHIYEKLS